MDYIFFQSLLKFITPEILIVNSLDRQKHAEGVAVTGLESTTTQFVNEPSTRLAKWLNVLL